MAVIVASFQEIGYVKSHAASSYYHGIIMVITTNNDCINTELVFELSLSKQHWLHQSLYTRHGMALLKT